jgi:hypothetical protein
MEQEHLCRFHPDKKALSFCHNCREYYCFACLKEGPEHYYCNDPKCQEALKQERNPPELQMPPFDSPETLPENLVIFGRFRNSIEANIIKTKLESEGIESFLFDEITNRVSAFPPAAVDATFGGVKLMVRESDADQAAQIMKFAEGPESTETLLQPPGPNPASPPATQPKSLTTIGSYTDPRDAEAAKALLDAAGIESFITDQFSSSGNYVQESVLLMVKESEAEKASGIIVKPEEES